jgi:hypothetical protein
MQWQERREGAGGRNMNIEFWQATSAVAVVGSAVWGGCRWWYQRQLRSLTRQLSKLSDTHEATMRMMGQTRKQVDDLQRLLAEYRRKLTTLELAQRRRPETKAPVVTLPSVDIVPALPPIRLPGGWADTQPM